MHYVIDGLVALVFLYCASQGIEGVDAAGAFPDRTDLGIADEACVHEVLDVTIPAAYFQCSCSDFDVIPACSELQKWRNQAQRGVVVDVLEMSGIADDRQRLLGGHHDL